MSAALEEQVALLHKQAEAALDRDDMPTALALADQAAARVKETLGVENALYANALFVQASLARIQKDLPRANQLYEKGLAVLEKLPEHAADLANALITLSRRYAEQANLERSGRLWLRARQVILERLPIDEAVTFNLAMGLGRAASGEAEALALDLELAESAAKAGQPRAALFFYARLAGHYANQDKLEQAGQAAQQAQAWLEKLDTASLATIPGALLSLGNVHLTLRNSALAAAAFQQAAGLLDENRPSNAEIFIDIVYGLAKASRQQQDYQQAEDRYQEMLSRTNQVFGKSHLRTAQSAARVGDFYRAQEQYTLARDYYEFSLQVREEKFGPTDLLVAETLNDLGICLDQNGQFTAAEKYYRRALAIREQRLTRSHPDTITSLFNLAELARIQGDSPTAEKRFREALDIPDIPAHLQAMLKNNLGELYTQAGRFDEARPLLQEALALRSQVFGAQSGDTARSLNSLGGLEFDQGRYQAAGEYFEQAHAIYQKENLRRFANTAAIEIAKALAFGGDIPAAIPLLETAVEEARSAYGSLHAQVAGAQTQLALFYAVQGQWQKARDTIWQAVEIEDQLLVEILLTASRSHAAAFLASARRTLSLYIGALLNDPQAAEEDRRRGYALILRRKGLETRLLRMLKPGLGVPPWKAERYAAGIAGLAELREQLTRAQLGGAANEADDLQQKISTLEKELAEAGLERSIEAIVYPLPAHAVSAALPQESVLVEYISLPDYAAGLLQRRAAPQRYAAFVLKAGGQMEENIIADVDALETVFALRPAGESAAPVLVDLGDAAQIDAGVDELLRAVNFGDDGQGAPRWRRRARFLYNRLIQPLAAELKDARHLIFAPDGALSALPFEILADAHGALLTEGFVTSYAQVGREVIRFWEHFNPGDPPLVIAAPDFDLPAGPGSPTLEAAGELDERLITLQAAPRFTGLAYTLAEGQAVAAALQAPLHSGSAALETLLKNSHSPEIVHMATHGFYLRREKPAAGAQTILEARSGLDDPLERSGLVFAGANAYLDLQALPERAQDGILFASEIVDLDLSQTDLVCLSACQSGQGEIRLGEGLKGLRSAFSAAGSRSLVCALWQIPDQASQQLITLFYAELLKGTPRAEALRSARQALQALYPRDPLFWAGLVLDGSPAPLYRFKAASTLKVATINLSEWGWNTPKKKKKPETPAEIAESLYDQGVELMEAGKSDNAFRAFDSAIRLPGALPETAGQAHLKRAQLLCSLGRFPEAFEEYDHLLAEPVLTDKLRVSMLIDRGTAYMQTKQFASAIPDYSAALASAGNSTYDQAWLLVNRGCAYRYQDQANEALADFSAVLALAGAPRDQVFKARLNRGDTRRVRGDYAGAVEDLSQALSMHEGSPKEHSDATLSRALAYYELGDYPHAIQDFSLLLQDDQLSAGYIELCLIYRARCCMQTGDLALAAADCKALLAQPGVSEESRVEAQAVLTAIK